MRRGPCIFLIFLVLVACTAVGEPPRVSSAPADAAGFRLQAQLFHDLNANGKRGENEPFLAGAPLTAGELHCTTGAEGDCDFGTLSRGVYHLELQAPVDFAFRIHATGHIYPAEDGLAVILNQDQFVQVGLTQGLFTTPFTGDPPIDRFYDHDPAGRITWWNEMEHVCPPADAYCTSRPVGTDQHSGTDFALALGEPVLAAAPGEVITVDGPEQCNTVAIYHGYYLGSHIFSGYSHLAEITVSLKQRVGRGQVIGRAGDTCTAGYPHLHFDVFSLPELEGARFMQMIDPFRSLVSAPAGYWQRSLGALSAPEWIREAAQVQDAGWWTVVNQPTNP